MRAGPPDDVGLADDGRDAAAAVEQRYAVHHVRLGPALVHAPARAVHWAVHQAIHRSKGIGSTTIAPVPSLEGVKCVIPHACPRCMHPPGTTPTYGSHQSALLACQHACMCPCAHVPTCPVRRTSQVQALGGCSVNSPRACMQLVANGDPTKPLNLRPSPCWLKPPSKPRTSDQHRPLLYSSSSHLTLGSSRPYDMNSNNVLPACKAVQAGARK